MLGPAYRALGPKILKQLIIQRAPGLDKQTVINRLVCLSDKS